MHSGWLVKKSLKHPILAAVQKAGVKVGYGNYHAAHNQANYQNFQKGPAGQSSVQMVMENAPEKIIAGGQKHGRGKIIKPPININQLAYHRHGQRNKQSLKRSAPSGPAVLVKSLID